MTVRDYINSILEVEEITDIAPVYYCFNTNTDKDPIYIEYRIIKDRDTDYASGQPIAQEIKVQVDVFASVESIDDYYALEKKIPKIFMNNDFDYYDRFETFETDTKLWHRGFRFSNKIIKIHEME